MAGLVPRHGMAMGTASSMDMAMGSATSTMSMPSSTSSMGDMDMGHMDHKMSSMHMYFTTQFKDYPVLFKTLSASTKAQAFGIFVLLFALAFIARGFEFLRNYMEQAVWKNPTYVDCHPETTAAKPVPVRSTTGGCCDTKIDQESINSESKQGSLSLDSNPNESDRNSTTGLSMAATVYRDIIRLILCFLPDLFGYALMLAAMTYTLTYFFAVVLGSAMGRFFFERLSDKYKLRAFGFAGHC